MPPWRRFRHRWQAWCALPPGEQRFLVRMVFLLPLVWLALRALGVRPLIAWALRPASEGRNQRDTCSGDVLMHGQNLARLTRAAAKLTLPEGSCLPQSIGLCRYLRKRGLNARLKIGVKSAVTPFPAHAWVELDDVPLEDGTEAFRQLLATPPPPGRERWI